MILLHGMVVTKGHSFQWIFRSFLSEIVVCRHLNEARERTVVLLRTFGEIQENTHIFFMTLGIMGLVEADSAAKDL